MQYRRNDLNLVRGTFRVRGDTLEFVGVDEELVHRIEFFGDEIEAINVVNMLTGEYVERKDELMIFPAKHFITPEEKLRRAIVSIEAELEERLAYFQAPRQAARGAAFGDADPLRSRHAPRGRLLQRHRELLAPSHRTRTRFDALVSDRLFPERLAALRRRVARDAAAGARHVRRRPLAQGGLGRARLSASERARQPSADLRRVRRAHQSGGLRLGDAGRRTKRVAARRSSR